MAKGLDWQKDRVRHQMAAPIHDEAIRRRYAGAMTTKRNVEALIARRNISHRTACLCPDQRRQHDDSRCPHLGKHPDLE